MSNLIKIQNVQVETGRTIVNIAVDAHVSLHPQLRLTAKAEKENREAILKLEAVMTSLGFSLESPKTWVRPNNWVDPNDGVESFLEWDFSDKFPKEEKNRVESQIKEMIG